MNYQKKLWALRERAWDAARQALDVVLATKPGSWPWAEGWQRYDAAVFVLGVLTRESDRAWADRRAVR